MNTQYNKALLHVSCVVYYYETTQFIYLLSYIIYLFTIMKIPKGMHIQYVNIAVERCYVAVLIIKTF